jgi:hypothetical protein
VLMGVVVDTGPRSVSYIRAREIYAVVGSTREKA